MVPEGIRMADRFGSGHSNGPREREGGETSPGPDSKGLNTIDPIVSGAQTAKVQRWATNLYRMGIKSKKEKEAA